MAKEPPIDWATVIEHAQTVGHPGRRQAWTLIDSVIHEPVTLAVQVRLGPRGAADVEDIVQEVYLSGDATFGGFKVSGDPVQSLVRWFCTIAHRLTVDRVRKGVRSDARDAQLDAAAIQEATDPTLARLVEQLLDTLPEEDAFLARRFGMEGLTFPELVPEIVAYRQQKGIYGGEPVNVDGLKKRWQRIRAKLFNRIEGKDEP